MNNPVDRYINREGVQVPFYTVMIDDLFDDAGYWEAKAKELAGDDFKLHEEVSYDGYSAELKVIAMNLWAIWHELIRRWGQQAQEDITDWDLEKLNQGIAKLEEEEDYIQEKLKRVIRSDFSLDTNATELEVNLYNRLRFIIERLGEIYEERDKKLRE